MENNKIVVLDLGNYTTCTVNLEGATVTSWRVNNQEQLFISRHGYSNKFTHIKGGIHFIFPHFGLWSFGPRHGFARILPWILEEGPDRTETQDVFAVFSLTDDPYTQSLWGYKFKLSYKITLCRYKLIFRICVENLCKVMPFEFHIIQNCLFRVPDVTECEIMGLRSCAYKDALQNDHHLYTEDSDKVTISGPTDKMYRNVHGVVTVGNMMKEKLLKIERKGTTDINLWNPGSEFSADIPELGVGEYKQLFAIKTGTLTEPIRLEPLCCWEACHIFELIEPRVDKKLLHELYDFFSGFC